MYPGMRMYGTGMGPGTANEMGPGAANGMGPGAGMAGGAGMGGGPGTTGYYPGFNMQGYDHQQQQQYFNNYGFNQQQQCDFQQFQQQQQYPGWEQQNPQQQQQQQQSWNMEWSWNRNQGGQYPNQDKDRKPSAGQTPAAGGQIDSSTAYQRTLQYVKNCQSWSSPEYPPQDQKDTKLKRPPTESQAMPPPSIPQMPTQHVHANGMPNGMQPMVSMPMNGMTGMVVKQDNMVLGDMNSSMNQLMEENRYLQMLH